MRRDRNVALAVTGLVGALLTGCGGVPEECVESAQLLAPAVIAFVDELPAGLAATPPDELRAEIDDRDGRTLDQVLLELNRFGLGGLQPAPDQDREELRRGLQLAREAACEVGDLRSALADEFAAAAAAADGETARRYEVIAQALRPTD